VEDFFALFFPAIHAAINWTRRPEFLDKELQQVVRDADLGRRLADKLVRVWLRDGGEAWILVHIEVQSQEEPDFARRMFIYYYRLYDKYAREVVSLAVLGDERRNWRPGEYTTGRWGCALRFSYPIVKLRDYRARRAELEASDNPFATVALAHLAAQETRRSAVRRREVKLALARRLYERGYSRERVVSLLRFIDWLLELPAGQEAIFQQEIRAYEEERAMPYVTSWERRGREEGREEGRQEGTRAAVRRVLRARFGAIPVAVEQRIAAADRATLDQLIERAAIVPAVNDL